MSSHNPAGAGKRSSGANEGAPAEASAGGLLPSNGPAYGTDDGSPTTGLRDAAHAHADTAAQLREAAALRVVARADTHGSAKVAQRAGSAALCDSVQDRLLRATLLTSPSGAGVAPAAALQRLRKVAAQLAGALAACHAAGVAHGALCPAVARFERPAPPDAAAAAAQGVALRLSGFGTAAALPTASAAGDAAAEADLALLRGHVSSSDSAVAALLADAAAYRPPEERARAADAPASAASDAWALGALLAQCALGRAEPLFPASLGAAAVAQAVPPALQQLRAADGALGDLVAALLCREAGARMSAAAVLRHPFLAPLGYMAVADARRAMPPPPPPRERAAAAHSPARPPRAIPGDGDGGTPAKSSCSAPPGSPLLSLAAGGPASAIAVVNGLLSQWEAAGLSPRSAARAAASRALPLPPAPPPPPPPPPEKPTQQASPPPTSTKRGRPPGGDTASAAQRRRSSAPLPQPRKQAPADDGARARRERRKSATPWWVVPKADE